MIISHKHKFIFLKNRKTAGTSIEIFLSRQCGSEDIITPIDSESEKIREKLKIYPQNYLIKKDRIFSDIIAETKTTMKFWNHITGDEIREKIGEDIWNSYYKFCFERNPWDKSVSLYFWDKAKWRYFWNTDNLKLPDISFDDYLKLDKKKIFRHYNYPIYTHQDEVIVDFIGKYEKLKDDLLKVCNKIGIKFDGKLENAHGNHRPKKHPYSYYYNDKNIELIKNHFKKEIELHGYTYEEIENQ